MKKYGSKDIMRIESILEKSNGDYMKQLLYSYNMACAITEPGKAMARGHAAQEVFGERSAVASVFFERAHDIGGDDVVAVVSVNQWNDTEEGVAAEFEGLSEEELPASRRKILVTKPNKKTKTSFAMIESFGRLNVIKGTGPQFDLHDYGTGILEVWEDSNKKHKIVFTSNYEPNYSIGSRRSFKHDNKISEWLMVDYIDLEHSVNLAPLYGKSIMIFAYS